MLKTIAAALTIAAIGVSVLPAYAAKAPTMHEMAMYICTQHHSAKYCGGLSEEHMMTMMACMLGGEHHTCN